MYANLDDVVTAFGEREVERLKTMHKDGALSVERALSDASERMNSYISSRYRVPVAKTGQLKLCCCNIARYFLYFEKASDEVKERYKDEIHWLENVANGKVKITFNEPLTVDEEQNVTVLPVAPVGRSHGGGVFGNDVFAKLPRP